MGCNEINAPRANLTRVIFGIPLQNPKPSIFTLDSAVQTGNIKLIQFMMETNIKLRLSKKFSKDVIIQEFFLKKFVSQHLSSSLAHIVIYIYVLDTN